MQLWASWDHDFWVNGLIPVIKLQRVNEIVNKLSFTTIIQYSNIIYQQRKKRIDCSKVWFIYFYRI